MSALETTGADLIAALSAADQLRGVFDGWTPKLRYFPRCDYEMQTSIVHRGNDLDVTIGYTVVLYDNRDVGLGTFEIEDWHIIAVNGVTCLKNPVTLCAALDAAQIGRIYEQCAEDFEGNQS